jgi:hypothetical protein
VSSAIICRASGKTFDAAIFALGGMAKYSMFRCGGGMGVQPNQPNQSNQ